MFGRQKREKVSVSIICPVCRRSEVLPANELWHGKESCDIQHKLLGDHRKCNCDWTLLPIIFRCDCGGDTSFTCSACRSPADFSVFASELRKNMSREIEVPGREFVLQKLLDCDLTMHFRAKEVITNGGDLTSLFQFIADRKVLEGYDCARLGDEVNKFSGHLAYYGFKGQIAQRKLTYYGNVAYMFSDFIPPVIETALIFIRDEWLPKRESSLCHMLKFLISDRESSILPSYPCVDIEELLEEESDEVTKMLWMTDLVLGSEAAVEAPVAEAPVVEAPRTEEASAE